MNNAIHFSTAILIVFAACFALSLAGAIAYRLRNEADHDGIVALASSFLFITACALITTAVLYVAKWLS
ncbi:hypothetical protein [Aquilutibacter rugosus]|uniref:hypothetical protein n=1 Tax=Aquilutibacter rugosus TaxID=3115820 RepID=UPI002F409D55